LPETISWTAASDVDFGYAEDGEDETAARRLVRCPRRHTSVSPERDMD
jgi:hypothetical protein